MQTYVVETKSEARLGRCWASDDRSQLELSDREGCPVPEQTHVWDVFRESRRNGLKRFENRIKAWAFPTRFSSLLFQSSFSNQVNIFCTLHVCPSECSQPVCGLRGRRALDEEEKEEKEEEPDEAERGRVLETSLRVERAGEVLASLQKRTTRASTTAALLVSLLFSLLVAPLASAVALLR